MEDDDMGGAKPAGSCIPPEVPDNILYMYILRTTHRSLGPSSTRRYTSEFRRAQENKIMGDKFQVVTCRVLVHKINTTHGIANAIIPHLVYYIIVCLHHNTHATTSFL